MTADYALIAQLRAAEAHNDDHRITVSNATTGHTHKTIAMCQDADTARYYAKAGRCHEELLAIVKGLRGYVPQDGTFFNPDGNEVEHGWKMKPEVKAIFDRIDAAISLAEVQ